MPNARDELLDRLDATVRSWREEVTAGQRTLHAHYDAALARSGSIPPELAEAHQDLATRIHEASQQLDTLVQILGQRLGGGGEHLGELRQLRREMAAAAQTRLALEEECDVLRGKVIEREHELDRLRGEQGDANATLQARFEREQETLHLEIATLRHALEAREADVAQLEREIARAGAVAEASPQESAQPGPGHNALEAEFRERLEAAEACCDARIQTIEAGLEALRGERDAAQRSLQEAHDSHAGAIDALQQVNAQLEARITQMHEDAEAAMEGGAGLIDALRADAATLAARMGEMAAEETRLRLEASCMRARLDTVARERDLCLRWATAWARAAAWTSAATSPPPSEELGEARTALTRERQAREEAQTALQREQAHAEIREEERKRLGAQKDAAERALEEARRAGEQTLHRLQAEAAAAKGRLAAAEGTLEKRDAEMEALRQQLHDAQRQAQATGSQTRRQLEAADSMAREYAARVAALEKERASLRQETQALTPVAARAQELERELEARRRECGALGEANAALRTELEEARTHARGRASMGLISDYHEEPAGAAERHRHAILVAEASAADPSERFLGEILVAAGVVSPSQIADALAVQRRNKDKLLGTILLERGFASEDAIAQAMAAQLGLAFIDPTAVAPAPEALEALDRDFCMWNVCMPLRMRKNRMTVAMANPLDKAALEKIQNLTRRDPRPVIAVPSRILQAIEDAYGMP